MTTYRIGPRHSSSCVRGGHFQSERLQRNALVVIRRGEMYRGRDHEVPETQSNAAQGAAHGSVPASARTRKSPSSTTRGWKSFGPRTATRCCS